MLQTAVVFQAPLWTTGDPFVADWYGNVESNVASDQSMFGGYWSRRLTIHDRLSVIEDWLEFGLGRDVTMYDTGLSPVFEGFVNTVTTNIGSVTTNKGPLLSTVANHVKVVYSTVDTTTTPPTVGIRVGTTWATNQDSIDRYGQIDRIISTSGSTPANAIRIRDLAIDQFKDPQVSETDNLGSSATPAVTIECLGYVHWLGAYIFNSTLTGDANASVKLSNVLAADPNGIFNTDTAWLTANTTPVAQWEDEDRTALQIVKSIVGQGDAGLNKWRFYFAPNRTPYYEAVGTEAYYERSLLDPAQNVRLAMGQALQEPWQVNAGEWVFFTDLLTTRSVDESLFVDPRFMLIDTSSVTMPATLSMQGVTAARLDILLARLGLGGGS